MKIFNTQYTTKNSILEFLKNNPIPNTPKVLLQIFTGIVDKDYIEELLQIIKSELPHINIIGATTDGEILEDKVLSYKTILSFMVFESTEIQIYTTLQQKSDFQTGKSLIQKFHTPDEAKLAITFADGLNTNGEVFLKAFSKYAPNITVAGGLASDNANFKMTYIFTKDGINSSGAIAAVLYNPNLIVNTSFSFGWEEIGKEHTITKAIENVVYSIDNLSPTQIYKKYLGFEIEQKLPATGIEFPLILNRDGKKIARAVINKNDDGSLVFAGNIKTGDKVYLGYGNIDHILENRFGLYEELSNQPIEGIFVYSCMARKRLLGQEVKSEVAPLSKVAPTVGFFTYGEFFYSQNKDIKSNTTLLNETMTVLTLSENKNFKSIVEDKTRENITENIQTVKALSHLISQTSKELNELNKTLSDQVQIQIEEIRKNEMVLYEQSKNAAMGEMIGNIAHQWRQPLSVISSGSTGMLMQKEFGNLSDEQFKSTCELINENAQFLSKTIDDFRNFIKGDRKLVSFNLKEEIENFLNLVHPSFKRHSIDVILMLEEKLQIKGYPNELIQCLMNLFNNAKDALKESEYQEKYLFITTYEKNENVVIEFIDNGGGIDLKVLPRIFEPYFTTKHKSQGTGLGLHMTYNLITKGMDGEINVSNIAFEYENKSYKGVEFRIILPNKKD